MNTTEIVPNQQDITVYQLMRLDRTTGNFIFRAPEYSKHRILGGLWADVTEVQHEQMLDAIKGTQWTIVKINWQINA